MGNLTKIDPPGTTNDRAYAYDAYSRMTCAKVGTACTGTGLVTYTLDALDRVLSRVGTATKTFTYSGMGETIARTQEGSNTLTYIHTLGGGSPLAQKKGSAIRWYLRDTHGDVVGLITPTGGNQGTVAFDPWGLKLGTTGSETSAFGYQGDLTDQSTGQVDMQTRWYEPQIGRFSTRDVLFGDPGAPPSLNQFAYTSGSPVTYWDPSGMGQCSQSNSCPRDEEGNQITGNPGAGSSYYGGSSTTHEESSRADRCFTPEPADPSVSSLTIAQLGSVFPYPSPSESPTLLPTAGDGFTACVDRCEAIFAQCMDQANDDIDLELCFRSWEGCVELCKEAHPPEDEAEIAPDAGWTILLT